MQQFDFSQLSVGERIGLAQSLLNSVQEEIDEPQINLAWRNEIENRAAELTAWQEFGILASARIAEADNDDISTRSFNEIFNLVQSEYKAV